MALLAHFTILTSAFLNSVQKVISLFLHSQSIGGRKKQIEQWEMV